MLLLYLREILLFIFLLKNIASLFTKLYGIIDSWIYYFIIFVVMITKLEGVGSTPTLNQKIC